MPFPIKTALSVIVLLVACAAYYYENAIGMNGPKISIIFLAPFMVIAMWIFPEVSRRKSEQ
jgi:hypothetical protein